MDASALPVSTHRDAIVAAIGAHPTLIITGDTGSGKTTQIPQYLLHAAPTHRVVVTQPRRIAAIMVARRVAHEMGVAVGGDAVGYAVRFDVRCTPNTRLKYCTDGVLVREAAEDASLSRYDVVIIDEAHERSCETDIALGLVKRARTLRPDLCVVVMSATLDVDHFSQFLGDAPIFTIPGRTFPVTVLHHRDPSASFVSLKSTYVQRVIDTVVYVHENESAGDVLVFVTGREEVERVCAEVRERCERASRFKREHDHDHGRDDVKRRREVANVSSLSPMQNPDTADSDGSDSILAVHVLPLYATLDSTPDHTRRIFDPSPPRTRKIIVATNIAQTSITIPGIIFVVDSGYVKLKQFDPTTNMDALIVVPISQATALQRAGRAGRTAPGVCYRIYSQHAFGDLEPATVPEIQRTSLIGTVLALKRAGVKDLLRFELPDPPDPALVRSALMQLWCLDAVDKNGELTKTGKMLSALPIAPQLARMVLEAATNHGDGDVLGDVITLAAVIGSGEDVWMQPREEEHIRQAERARDLFRDSSGDHVTLVNVFESWSRHRDNQRGSVDRWCREHFVRRRAMEQASKVRDQLVDITERGCHVRVPRTGTRRPQGSGKREQYVGDPATVLLCLCAGFAFNTAKRHASRSVFYHYLSSTTGASSAGLGMMALHLSPDSVLNIPTLGDAPNGGYLATKLAQDALDWVVYDSVVFTTRAQMRIVSRVRDSAWVQARVDGKLKNVNVAQLMGETMMTNGIAAGEIENDNAEADGVVTENVRIDTARVKAREEKVSSARARYVQRRDNAS